MYKSGLLAEALMEIIKKAVALVGDDPVIYEHLGEIYLKQQKVSDARDAWLPSHWRSVPPMTKLLQRFREQGLANPAANEDRIQQAKRCGGRERHPVQSRLRGPPANYHRQSSAFLRPQHTGRVLAPFFLASVPIVQGNRNHAQTRRRVSVPQVKKCQFLALRSQITEGTRPPSGPTTCRFLVSCCIIRDRWYARPCH